MDAIIEYLQAAFGEELDGGGIGDALLLKNTSGQSVRVVVLGDITGSLDNDRTLVVLVIDEMNRAAGDLTASG